MGLLRRGDDDTRAADAPPAVLPGSYASVDALADASLDELADDTLSLLFGHLWPEGDSFHPPSEMRRVWKAMGIKASRDLLTVEWRVEEGASELLRRGMLSLGSSSAGHSFRLSDAGRKALGRPLGTPRFGG
jgi:hypothetical protein